MKIWSLFDQDFISGVYDWLMEEAIEKNTAFIDGQNLYLGTKENGWAIDHARFRVYLLEKYKIIEAYYFLGFISADEEDLYDKLKQAGFVLLFREHSSVLRGYKKGNVDSDVIFEIMRKFADTELIGKVFLVSGDGDYKKLIDYLIIKGKFGKILFPSKKSGSSLYQSLGSELYDYLENNDIKDKISYNPKRKRAP